jgi:hypothetical protein
VHHGRGGLLVELADNAQAMLEKAPQPDAADSRRAGDAAGPDAAEMAPPATNGRGAAPPAVTGTAADGLREFRRILSGAAIRRWPMYLRNVKQMLRQADAAFDERAYGFGNLTDLLRAAHREGIVRVDRDRQGVIRVFQGSVSSSPVREATEPSEAPGLDAPADDVAVAAAAAEIGVPIIAAAAEDLDPVAPRMPRDDADDAGAAAASPEPTRKRRARAPRTSTGTRTRRRTKSV